MPTRHGSSRHYATFSADLTLKPILAGCPKGGIVLDPFCGTGTTGVAAIGVRPENLSALTGRKSIAK
ncbi:MAG: DNA methyltransferase [Bacteroidota bacterium]